MRGDALVEHALQPCALPGTASVVGEVGELVSEPSVRLEFCLPRGVPGGARNCSRPGADSHMPWA